LPIVRGIHERLKDLPAAEKLPPPSGSQPSAVRELAAKVARLTAGDTALCRAVADLAAAVESCPYAADRLREFDRRLAADLAAGLQHRKAASGPAPITLADVPAEFRERYVGSGGEYLVRAFARESLWDYSALERFTTAAAAVDPEATGRAFGTLEGLWVMKVG